MRKISSICLFFIVASLLLPAVVVFAQNVQFSTNLKRGSIGQDVSRLQEFLRTMSNVYPEGLVTGYFGALTEKAVQRFQSKYGIVLSGSPTTTGYGLVGPRTRAKLNSLIAPETLSQQPQPQQLQPQRQQPQQQPQRGISVKATGSKYKTVTTKPTTGWFKTGQDADILLSGIDFNNTGGPLLFNHPGEISSDGTRLLLADRNNNRVFIWNKLPTGNTPPDLVLGQLDFIQNNPGTGLNQFNWPSSVAVANGKVVVADTENYRILVWNFFPTQNAQPADMVIDINKLSRDLKYGNFEWPWGVWTDGTKLAVSATRGSRVLIWNTFPTHGDQPPDIVLTAQGKFGTPRGITSNGQYLIVGDHNAKVPISTPSGNITDGPATFVWKTWPSSNDQPYDFYLEGMRAGTFLPDNRLILMSTTHYPVSIWNAPPISADDAPDLILGNTAGPGGPGFNFVAGDSSKIVSAGGRLYFSLANGNKIVVYNTVPTNPLAMPDFAIGATDIRTNTLETNFLIGNPLVATDGKSLFVASDFERKLYVWKSVPDESSADPDFVYDLFGAGGEINFSPQAIAVDNNKLVLAGRSEHDRPTVYIWTKLPLGGEMPNLIFRDKIGSVNFQNLQGVALDDKYFYLADGYKIYVWEGLPTASSDPKFTLSTQGGGRLDSDGKYLVGSVNYQRRMIGVWKIADLSSSSEPSAVPMDPHDITRKFNLPASALIAEEHLFVADTGFNRVLIWNNIADSLAGKQPDIILGATDLSDISPEIGKNKLFSPASMAFDDSFLWVGEFKFSSRLLRFSIK